MHKVQEIRNLLRSTGRAVPNITPTKKHKELGNALYVPSILNEMKHLIL